MAGLLGMRPDDARLPRSFELAEAAGMELTLGRTALRGPTPTPCCSGWRTRLGSGWR